MKKTTSICFFVGILALCIAAGAFFFWPGAEEETPPKLAEAETETQEKMPASAESMTIKEPYEYVLHAIDGFLVVYAGDGKTLLFETNIRTAELDSVMMEKLEEGIHITDEKELYDFLESYSS